MAATARALFLVAAVTALAAAVLGVANGASYTVGAPAGSWDLQTNYTRWASTITFRAGDQLVFKYARGAHDVVEVSKAGYDACSATSPLASFATGDDTVSLPAAGVTRYFICGLPGHCAGGMKLAVRVEAATTSPSPAPVAVAPRAAARPPTASSSAPSPAPVAPAMAPREAARSPMATTPPAGGKPPAAGGVPAVPPSSSAAAMASGVAGSSLAGLGFATAVAALMALY